jgi:hypothetical protein
MKNPIRKLFKDTRGEVDYAKFIIIVIAIFIATSLVGSMYTQISNTNTTGWSSLTGGSGAVTLYQLIFFVFIASIVIYIVREALK